MKTTAQLVKMLMRKYDLRSVYGLAKLLNQTHTSAARWAGGKGSFSDETAMHVADLLDLDPAYVVACIHAERAKAAPEKAIWQRIAERMAVAATLSAIVFIAWAMGGTETAPLLAAITSPVAAGSQGLYIMSNAAWIIITSLAAFYVLAFWGSALRRHLVAGLAALSLIGCATPEPVQPREKVTVWRDASGTIRMKSEPTAPPAPEVISDTPRRAAEFRHMPPHRPSLE